MVAPYLPVDPETNISITYQPVSRKYQYQTGQVTMHHSLSTRKIPTEEFSCSFYCRDIQSLENFLLNLAGLKPFKWIYNQRDYICINYNIQYIWDNTGTMSMDFINYTNLEEVN